MRIDDDVRQTMRDGAALAYRLLQWFRAEPSDRGPIEPPAMLRPTTIWTVAAALAAVCVGLLVFFGVIAVGLKVFELGFEPILDAVSGRLFVALLIPGVLPALALAVLALGLPVSRKFRPRGRFVTGLASVAGGFASLWQLPKLMARLPTPEARVELEAPLLIGGLVVSGFLLVCGLQLMGSCQWVSTPDGRDDNE